jgi:hypothetical protein
MNNDEETPGNETPPYLSPTTFLNFIDAHRRTLPTRIDRSMMPTLSGGDQVRILKTLRFFGLIEENGEPTPSLHKLATLESADLQHAWATLLRHAYPYLFEGFNLEKATHGQIEERFREKGIKGETVRKAVAFFIGLARTADLKLSPYFKGMKKPGSSGPRTPRKVTRRSSPRVEQSASAPAESGGGSYVAASITFSGGVVAELRVTGNAFSLAPTDRSELFDWIDKINAHAKKSGSTDSNSATPASTWPA